MDQLHSLRVFLAVVDGGSFAGAARRLKLSPPAVTRSIADLERHLGVTLLSRTTRVVRVTDAGAQYAADSRRILAELEQADAAASGAHGSPSGSLTVTASVLFGRIHVTPIVTEFLHAHPQMQVKCLFADFVVALNDEGVDVAIRIGDLEDSSLRAIRVGSVRRVVCAAPAYLQRHGVPKAPGDLISHSVVVATGLSSPSTWRFRDGTRDIVSGLRPRLTMTTNDAAIAAAVGGFGVTRLLSYQVAEELRSGALQVVLSEYETAPVPVHVVHRHGRRPSAKVRAFVDLATVRLRAADALR